VLPPGPSLPQPLQLARFVRRPVGFMDECAARYGHVFTLRMLIGGPSVWVAEPSFLRDLWSRDADHRLNAGRKFLLEPVLGRRSVLLQVGDEHLRRRRLMLPPFHGERMRGYARVMEEMTARDIEQWPVGEPFPLLERMQRITLDVILRAVFGTAEGEREDNLRARLRDLLAQSNDPRRQIALTLDLFAGGRIAPFASAVKPVDRLIAQEVAERRRAGGLEDRDDILSLLMLARDEDGEGLSDTELRDQLVTLLVAGHETTATGLAWAFDALFRHEPVLTRLRREVASSDDESYLGAVVDESLRVRPVVPEVGRRLGAPLALNGHTLPAGTDVFASVQLTHRRADLFPDPLAFRPERFLEDKPSTYSWIPFGGGTRRCLGAAFAQFEMRRVLATVLKRAELEPATDAPEPVERRPVTLAPRHGTPAVLTARS
jgi:cytochrome P450